MGGRAASLFTRVLERMGMRTGSGFGSSSYSVLLVLLVVRDSRSLYE